jgi:hypothetical protein
MEIVYTYKSPTMKIYSKEINQKDWISRSIQSARMVGYLPHLYTNDLGFAEGLNLDNVTLVIDNHPEVWDTIKPLVLSMRSDTDFFISDNDVIYKKPIPFDDTVDFFYDGIETENWEWVYSKSIRYFEKHKIFDCNPLWDYKKRSVLNMGVFKFNNLELKNFYVKEWYDVYERLIPYYENLDPVSICAIINQYPITLISDKYNYTKNHFTNNGWPGDNEYYNHFPGYSKVKSTQLI